MIETANILKHATQKSLVKILAVDVHRETPILTGHKIGNSG
jgi:hypothetical protein